MLCIGNLPLRKSAGARPDLCNLHRHSLDTTLTRLRLMPLLRSTLDLRYWLRCALAPHLGAVLERVDGV